VKDDIIDLIADSHIVLAGWGIYFSKPFNEHGLSEVKQREILTPGPQVVERSAPEFVLVIENLNATNH